MTELIGVGGVRPVLDGRYRLGQVAAALRYVEQGRVKGKVVITMDGADE